MRPLFLCFVFFDEGQEKKILLVVSIKYQVCYFLVFPHFFVENV